MKRFNLNDVTFLLLVRIDSVERMENVLQVSNLITKTFATNVCLWEISPYCNGILQTLLPYGIRYKFIEDKDPILHRTRYLNKMLSEVDTQYVSVWDVDVIIHYEQILQAVDLLRNGTDFVYPYANLFLETTTELRLLYLKSDGDIRYFMDNHDFMIPLYAPNPVGGAFFARRSAYIESGGENEIFYGWGMEDGERYNRWKNLGYKIQQVKGPLYHMTHPRFHNSQIKNMDTDLQMKRELYSSIRKTAWNKKS